MRYLPGLVFAAAMVGSAAAHAQAFDCRKAHFADEKLICHTPALSRLDEQLTAVYNRAFDGLPASGQRRLDREEDRWVVSRRQCGADADCIDTAYHRRLRELAALSRYQPEA